MHAAWWCVTAYRFKETPWARLWCPARCCLTPSRMPCDAILRLGISQSCINSKPASPTSIVHCAGWWKFRNWSHSGFEALLILKFVLIFIETTCHTGVTCCPKMPKLLRRLRDMPDLDVRIFKYGSRVVHWATLAIWSRKTRVIEVSICCGGRGCFIIRNLAFRSKVQ